MIDSANANVLIQLTPDQLSEFVQQAVQETLRSKGKTASDSELNDWLTRKETSDLLHVSFPTLRRYEQQKILIPHRIGKRVLYSRKDVEARLQEGYNTNQRRYNR